jgi:hypothetical protein
MPLEHKPSSIQCTELPSVGRRKVVAHLKLRGVGKAERKRTLALALAARLGPPPLREQQQQQQQLRQNPRSSKRQQRALRLPRNCG